MKSFRMMRHDHTNAGPVASFAGYVIGVDLAHAIEQALALWGLGHYSGVHIPGPIPVTYSPAGEWYSGLRF
jgi:hypothetical protein